MSDAIPYKQIIDRVKSDIDWIAEQAHAKGYNEAKLIYQNPNAESDYQRGLNDAWETITKIAKMPDGERDKVFGETRISNILNKFNTSEIINILDGYEPDLIKVGDEVRSNNAISDHNGVVLALSPEGNGVKVLENDGSMMWVAANVLTKTGRHFNFLMPLLEAMKGEQRNCHTCKHKVTSSIECVDCHGFGKWEPKEGTE